MNSYIYTIIIGMAIITYLLRYLSFPCMSKLNLSPRAHLFLRAVPYAALSALVFPDVFTAIADERLASFLGFFAAVIFSSIFPNIMVGVIAAIGVSFLVLLF